MNDWKYFFERKGDDALMVHDWPECGPGSIKLEELYQAFKARLLSELAVRSEAGWIISHDPSYDCTQDDMPCALHSEEAKLAKQMA